MPCLLKQQSDENYFTRLCRAVLDEDGWHRHKIDGGMTELDSLTPLSIADGHKNILKGIHVTEPVSPTCSEVELCADAVLPFSSDPLPWSYLFIHHSKVQTFEAVLQRDGMEHYIHRSVRYQRKKHGVKGIEKPTVSGLVFVRGTARQLQQYLDRRFEGLHLVNDCSTGRPAVIPHARMEVFMRVMAHDPARVRLLLHPLQRYADGNTRLRIVSGFLAGLEGYIVRINRDRCLVLAIGNMTVAIGGIHLEQFEIVHEE